MDNFEILRKKLEAFIRKFYLNELLKGFIFFVAIGLLYFIITLFIEHLLWLNSTGRSILFWSFVGVELFLFGSFIIYPLLKLFRISRGIGYTEASRIIGRHFPEVSDKLLNLLQLKEKDKKTDLLMASIDQKAADLRPVPFTMAVDLKKNLPYLKYAAIPVLIIILVVLSGRTEVFSGSYERVVNYKTAYEPPAPFSFQLLDDRLRIKENEPLTIQVSTTGRVIPQDASVQYNGQNYYMKRVSPGLFEYTFEPAQASFDFQIVANKVSSPVYKVEVVEVPKMRNLRMILDYPAHTGLGEEVVEGTGNATVPEGTLVNWELETSATNNVEIKLPDTLQKFEKQGDLFRLQKRFSTNVNYEISTSNAKVKNFENLNYQIRTVRDEHPELILEQQIDSLDPDFQYFFGKVSDDYGIRSVNLVVEEKDDRDNSFKVRLPHGKGNVGEFVTSFPDTLGLEKGKTYEFYFEVIDNDAINGFKRVKSRVFSYNSKTDSEEKQQRLQEQRKAIQGIDGSLEKMKLSEKELEELSRLQREKKELNYNDRKKLENFLQRQKQQNRIMENFTEKLKRNLQEETTPQNKDLKKNLEERLENREEDLEENEKLLEELEKYSEKIMDEGLQEKLQELSKNARNQERSLEQLLELTKKYYVQEKSARIAEELEELGEEQQELAEEDSLNTKSAQDSLSQKTDEVFEELEELEKENEGLKKPLEIPESEEEQEGVKDDQQKAGEELDKQNMEGAKKEQKKAGEKLMQMSKKMKQQMQQAGMQQMQEDVTMLRQILDNLVTFSFGQEDLMEDFRKLGTDNTTLPGKLRRQDLLRENFRHIDDSLYSLALRNEMISEPIMKKLIDVDYSLDQTLERLAQNEIRMGLSSQQYVITGANDLAYLLSDILGNMEEMLNSSPSKGSGQGQQLQDIIQKQGELNEEMKEQMQKGDQKQKGEQEGKGENGQSGEEESGELFRIFQEQQMLRRALDEKLKEEGRDGKGNGVKKEMEQIEKQLLEKGFDPGVLQRMQRLEHRLLELEEAELQQGKKPERESTTGKEVFSNETKSARERAKEYFNTTEILNRQTLPLRPVYKLKVKEYFERRDN
ncbi:coiled-coil domain-containing protein [Salinimicrobium sp. CAU 1759]